MNPCMKLSSDNRSEELPRSERNPASAAYLVAVMSNGSEPWRKCNEGAVDLKRALSIEWGYTAASICGGTMGILCGAERLKSVCSQTLFLCSAVIWALSSGSYDERGRFHKPVALRPLSNFSKWLSVRRSCIRTYFEITNIRPVV